MTSGSNPWRTSRAGKMLALAQGHNDWYRIIKNDSGPSKVHIYDEIGFFGITAADFIRDLEAITGPIHLHLNSPGGEVNDGLTIYNSLLAREKVDVFIDGMAGSIASVIAMAGDEVNIAETGQMMIHNAFTMAIGDAEDLRRLADRLEETTEVIANIYASRTGQTAEHWVGIMAEEGWYRGQEAIDAGLADNLIKSRSPKSKSSSTAPENRTFELHGVYAKVPGDPEAETKNAAAGSYIGSTDTAHAPVTGVHSHNHAAFGHSDSVDGIHHHPHSHDGDATHEHGHMSHDHQHDHSQPHLHAHDEGQDRYGDHTHDHTHEADGANPAHDGTGDSGSQRDRVPGVIMSEMGLFENVKKPYGDVPYADPGYLDANGEQVSKSGKEGVARYPVDEEHVVAAWSYINQKKNAGQYTSEQLSSIKGKIKSAMSKHGHDVSEDDKAEEVPVLVGVVDGDTGAESPWLQVTDAEMNQFLNTLREGK